MLAPRILTLLALTLACPSCQASAASLAASTGAGPTVSGRSAQDPLPRARQAVQVRVGDSSNDSLAELVTALSSSTGVAFTMSDHVRSMLSQTRSGVTTNVEIPPDQLWPWVEGLLVHHGFALTARTTEAPFLLGVWQANGRDGAPRYLRVEADQLASYAQHPALMIRTTLHLPHTDVRQLGNSLRAISADPSGSQMVVPVGNTSSIILSGTGSQVFELMAILQEVERVARGAHEEGMRELKRKQAGGAEGTSNGEK